MVRIAGWRKIDIITWENLDSKKRIMIPFNRSSGKYDVELYQVGRKNILLNYVSKKKALEFAIKYMKANSGVVILNKIPKGYRKVIGATTNPSNAALYSNGESRFSGKRKTVLVRNTRG
jgi:hypothetical protein